MRRASGLVRPTRSARRVRWRKNAGLSRRGDRQTGGLAGTRPGSADLPGVGSFGVGLPGAGPAYLGKAGVGMAGVGLAGVGLAGVETPF